MSENNSEFNPSNNEGTAPSVEGYKWGFNFKSVKGANTDMTYGWKASGVVGLSTSVYVSPLAMGPVGLAFGAAGAAAGAITGAITTGDAGTDAATGVAAGYALAGGALVTPAILNMIYSTDFVYEKLMMLSNLMYTFSPVNITNPYLRPQLLSNIAAYMTVEVGSKKDTVIGNKHDFVTGSVNKTVNGETVVCHADKVEWYYADLYKYVQGTETKMEKAGALSTNALTSPEEQGSLLRVVNNKSDYAKNSKEFASITKKVAAREAATVAPVITHSATQAYTLNALNATINTANAFTMTAVATSSLTAGGSFKIGSMMGPLTLQAGTNGILIDAFDTVIPNLVSLGSPDVLAVADVAAALEAFAAAEAEMLADVASAAATVAESTAVQAVQTVAEAVEG